MTRTWTDMNAPDLLHPLSSLHFPRHQEQSFWPVYLGKRLLNTILSGNILCLWIPRSYGKSLQQISAGSFSSLCPRDAGRLTLLYVIADGACGCFANNFSTFKGCSIQSKSPLNASQSRLPTWDMKVLDYGHTLKWRHNGQIFALIPSIQIPEWCPHFTEVTFLSSVICIYRWMSF